MVITLFSPDKLSLSMFTDYYKTLYDGSIVPLDINGFYSGDIQENLFKMAIEKSPNRSIIVRYKAYKKSTPQTIPLAITEGSTYVIQFDLFSTVPVVLKGEGDPILQGILDRWERNIKKFDVS